jgi:EmrB/QacA subfamily drug resistance transporter
VALHHPPVGLLCRADAPPELRLASARGRWVVAAAVLGSGVAFLDSTVVNVALPSIGTDLGAKLAGLQWIVDAYLLTLGALILLGGSLGDLYGRRRIFVLGLVAFAVTSAGCGVAPSTETLIAARALQGIAAALLVPQSLALISASFHPGDRGAAIGAWSGLAGSSTAIGPFLGGWLVDSVSWRLVFLINLPLVAIAVALALRWVPETRDETGGRRPDVAGAATAALGLGGVVYALIEGPALGALDLRVAAAAVAGVVLLLAFVIIERRRDDPMVPPSIFRSRQFVGANLTTLAVYAALIGTLFLLVLELRRGLGYSALQAGAATMPVTVLLLVFSAPAGRLSQRIGPRLPMTLGPLIAAVGMALMSRVGPGASYVTVVLPALLVFGAGLALTVAPLTETVLAAVTDRMAGIGSAINNAVARIAGLLSVAILPVAAGFATSGRVGGSAFNAGVQRAFWITAALCAIGGAIAWCTVRNTVPVEGAAGDRPQRAQ